MYRLTDLLNPVVWAVWVPGGLVLGLLCRKLLNWRRRGGGGLSDLINTTLIGMIGVLIGVAAGLTLRLPGAGGATIVSTALAFVATFILMLILRLVGR